jgi:hypothetical protein
LSIKVTNAPFAVIKRPPISRRQLHLMGFSKGGKRRKYGGSTTRHGFRKGDLVSSPKGIGYVSGDTEKQLGTCVGIISQPENRSVEESDQPDGILSKRKSLIPNF